MDRQQETSGSMSNDSKRTLRDTVYEELRSAIISGDVFPGERLTLRSLSERFDVSIVPVREALFQLESEGAIVRRNNRDYRVNTLKMEQFSELYQIRELIELHIARTACGKQPASAAEELGSICEAFEASTDNPKEFVRLNEQFHFALYSYAGMPALLAIIRALWARIGPYLSIHIDFLEDLSSSVANHVRMYERFVDRDTRGLVSLLRADLNESHKVLTPLVRLIESDISSDLTKSLLTRRKRENQG